jgi:hypothetical protein
MHKRKFWRTSVILCVVTGALLIGAVPGHTFHAGSGTVAGEVTVTPAIPIAPCTATTYTFSSTVIVGAVTQSVSGNSYVGTIPVSATGGSVCESDAGAGGTVSITSAFGNADVRGNGNTIDCDAQVSGTALSGVFVRKGTVVEVDLRGTCTIDPNGPNPPGPTTESAHVNVAANFTPTNPGGGANTQARFAGEFTFIP